MKAERDGDKRGPEKSAQGEFLMMPRDPSDWHDYGQHQQIAEEQQ